VSIADDARVRFFLKHREEIEAWAGLKGTAVAAVDEWLTGLEPIVVELDCSVRLAGTRAYPSYRCRRSHWPAPNDEGDDPVAVCLEWDRSRTALTSTSSPYVGLRIHKLNPVGGPLREAESLKKIRSARRDISSPWWVGYSYVIPHVSFPEEPERYQDAIVSALRSAWQAYAPAVDTLLAERAP
jgi:hypothetical protein